MENFPLSSTSSQTPLPSPLNSNAEPKAGVQAKAMWAAGCCPRSSLDQGQQGKTQGLGAKRHSNNTSPWSYMVAVMLCRGRVLTRTQASSHHHPPTTPPPPQIFLPH